MTLHDSPAPPSTLRTARSCRARDRGGWQVRFNDARRFDLMLIAADEALASHKLFRDWAPNRSTPLRRRRPGEPPREADAHQRRPCSIRRRWSVSATSTPARRCSSPASHHGARRTPSRASAPTGGGGHQAGSAAIDRRWRIDLARSRAARRRAGIFSDAFQWYTIAPGGIATRSCGRVVRRLVQAGRSTFYCANCQLG